MYKCNLFQPIWDICSLFETLFVSQFVALMETSWRLRNCLGQCQNIPWPLARPFVNLLAELTGQQITQWAWASTLSCSSCTAEYPTSGFAHWLQRHILNSNLAASTDRAVPSGCVRLHLSVDLRLPNARETTCEAVKAHLWLAAPQRWSSTVLHTIFFVLLSRQQELQLLKSSSERVKYSLASLIKSDESAYRHDVEHLLQL